MIYKIQKGDRFKCIKTFKMETGEKVYTKGVIYTSEVDSNITDNEPFVMHDMEGVEEFFEHFKLLIQ